MRQRNTKGKQKKEIGIKKEGVRQRNRKREGEKRWEEKEKE